MKVYISVDLEGCCGVTHWDETTKTNAAYHEFQKQMTEETRAACRGALAAGASEIVIRDAHDSARNILANELPEKTRLIRGWSGHPYQMMDGLDNTFQAVIMLGYHCHAGSGGSPLAHTMSTTSVDSIFINGMIVSEFLINSYITFQENVPLILLSGDQEVCFEASRLIPGIAVVPTKSGFGGATLNFHPKTIQEQIETAVRDILPRRSRLRSSLPDQFETIINYTHHKEAFKASFFPAARLSGPRQIQFTTTDYFELLRMLLFIL